MRDDGILDVKGLCTFYGSSQALFGVDLRVPRRGAVAILGRNGVGKTTVLRSVVGELRPAQGHVFLGGEDVTSMPTERRIRKGLGYVPQQQAVFGSLTVRENLRVGLVADNGKTNIEMVLDVFPKLGQRLSQQAGTLSGGERKMLAIGRALLSDPSVLLLDEPTEGVWHEVVEEIAERLHELAKTRSVVIVEQHLDLALRVSDYVYVLDRGRVALEGGSTQVRDDPALFRYLTP